MRGKRFLFITGVVLVALLAVGWGAFALAAGPVGNPMMGTFTDVDCPGPGWGMGWPGTPGGNLGQPISDEQAIAIAQEYVVSYGNPDLELVEIMAFDNQFYGQVREKSTGINAFEFLIDRYSGAAYPEPGPNMMWNVKYGHMAGWGGMMGGWWTPPSGEMRITPEKARELAQNYLDVTRSGLEVADDVDEFYGYYTIHTLRDGQIVGMLSVNGYSGQVWPHTWHGQFLGMIYELNEGEGH